MAPKTYTRPYLDSSVYIAAIKGENSNEPPDRPPLAKALLDEARTGQFVVVASTFVLVEVLHRRGKDRLTAQEEAAIDQYLTHSGIVWVELDRRIAMEARRLARAHNLRPADAVHLASAIRGKADQLLRWDDRWPAGTFDGVVVCDPHRVGRQESIPLTP